MVIPARAPEQRRLAPVLDLLPLGIAGRALLAVGRLIDAGTAPISARSTGRAMLVEAGCR